MKLIKESDMDKRLNPKKANVRKVCDAMGWKLPMFSDDNKRDGYACKWGMVTPGRGKGFYGENTLAKAIQEYGTVDNLLDEIENRTGIRCRFTGKLVIPYAQ